MDYTLELPKKDSLPQKTSLNYLKKEVPIAAGNYSRILKLNEEMSVYLEKLDATIGGKIAKDEFEIIIVYQDKMQSLYKELDTIKEAYSKAAEGEMSINKDIETLKVIIRKQWDDIKVSLDLCKKYKLQIQELLQLNEQMKSNQKGHEKQLKKYMLENKRLKSLVIELENKKENRTTIKSNTSVELPRRTYAQRTIELQKPLLNTKEVLKEDITSIEQYNEYIKNINEYYEYNINKLKKQLRLEKNMRYKLKLQKRNSKDDLEELFLDCVEEVCSRYLNDNLDIKKLRKLITSDDKRNIMMSFITSQRFIDLLHVIKEDIRNMIELPSLMDYRSMKRLEEQNNSKRNKNFANYSSYELNNIKDSNIFIKHKILSGKLNKRLKLLNPK